MKFKIGNIVKIRVCNFTGLVVGSMFLPESDEKKYEVTFPDEHGLPASRWFFEVELEETSENKFGFRI